MRILPIPSSCLAALGSLLLTFFVHCAVASAQVVISEVLWAGSDLSSSDEWLEITSTVDTAVSLAGWKASFVNSSGIETPMLSFGTAATILPGEYQIIARQHASSSRILSEPAYVNSSVSLLNTKLLLRLRNASGALIDEVDDGVGEPFAGRNLTNGSGALKASMERIDLRAPGNLRDNWRTAEASLGLDGGALVLATPGYPYNPPSQSSSSYSESSSSMSSSSGSTTDVCAGDQLQCDTTMSHNSSFSSSASQSSSVSSSFSDDDGCEPVPTSGVEISELLPNPDGDETAGEWIELSNPTDQSIDLCGWFVDDGPQGGKPYSLTGKSIPPFGYVLLPREATKIALDNNGDSVRLFAGQILVAEVAYSTAPASQSYARDTFGVFTWTSMPTPGSANRFPVITQDAPDEPSKDFDVVISAAKPNPPGPDSLSEWVEIENREDVPVQITGWWISTRASPSKRFIISALNLKPKSGYKLYAIETGLGLVNTSDAVRLYRPDGSLASELSWQNAEENKVYRTNHLAGRRVRALVTHVVDGDTMDVAFDQPLEGLDKSSARVRIVGVDTPEITQPGEQLTASGLMAKEFVRALIENKKIELEFDSELTDKYDRLLAYIYLDDGRMLEEELLKNGLGYAYLHFPFSKSARFTELQNEAKQRGIGIWEALETGKIESLKLSDTGSALTVAIKKGSGASIPPASFGGVDYRTDISISEVYPAPRKIQVMKISTMSVRRKKLDALGHEWIELMNPSREQGALGGWSLRVGSGSRAYRHTFVPGTVIAPGGFLIVDDVTSKLKLSNEGSVVFLVSPDGKVQKSLTFPKLRDGQSFAAIPSIRGDVRYCHSLDPTPATENRCALREPKMKKVKVKRLRVRKAKKKASPAQTAINRKLRSFKVNVRPYQAPNMAENEDSTLTLLKELRRE